MRKDNFTQVLKHFVHELKIPVTCQSIENELQIHPDYNSFVAISDVLNTWHVPNAAYQLTFDELLGAEIDNHFIAFISDKEFVVVSHLDNNYALVSNEKWNNHKLPIQQFKDIFSGSILLAEKDEASGDRDYIANRRQEIYDRLLKSIVLPVGAIILLSFVLYHSGFFSNFSSYKTLLMLLKTAGICAAGLLTMQSFNLDNPIFQKLCGSAYHNDCNAVFSAKKAKIYDLITWSEIGLFYFASSWLILMFNSTNMPLLQALGILNLISLPFTFYLIYLQWKVINEWCILCCIVQALLWFEFIVFLPLISNGLLIPNLTDLVNLAIGITMPIVLWTFIKLYLISSKKRELIANEQHTFKYNRGVFQASLNESPKYQLLAHEDSITFGNQQAENILTLVIKPYGKLSAEAYQGLRWLNGRDDITLQIVFATPYYVDDPDTQVASHMLSLKESKDNLSLKKTLDDWFNQMRKNYDDWADMYPSYKNDKAKEAIEANRKWCKITDVSKIPTIFINGQKLTLNYKTSDLKYFI